MVSLRSAAIALVASAAILGVLVGVTTAKFTVPTQDPPIDPTDQQVTAQQHRPVGPPIMAPQPNPVNPPVTAPQPNPAPPQPNSADRPVSVARPAPIHREPVVPPIADRQAPVNAQPGAVAPPPAPDVPPPSSAAPARNSKSRTSNTEPCACDGQMRQVRTHWDPPEG